LVDLNFVVRKDILASTKATSKGQQSSNHPPQQVTLEEFTREHCLGKHAEVFLRRLEKKYGAAPMEQYMQGRRRKGEDGVHHLKSRLLVAEKS
jgi:hypothetical protein